MKSDDVLHTLQAWKNERFEILALWVAGPSQHSPGYTTLSFRAFVSDVNESELHLAGSSELAGFFNLEDASWTVLTADLFELVLSRAQALLYRCRDRFALVTLLC
jgi:hypothetical protein